MSLDFPGVGRSTGGVSDRFVLFVEQLEQAIVLLERGGSQCLFPFGGHALGASRTGMANSAGTNVYRLPEFYGRDATIHLRLDQPEDDAIPGLNWTENIRVIAPSDPDFRRLYGRRQDTESINRRLEDSLFIGRATRWDTFGQQMNLLGFALTVNSLGSASGELEADPFSSRLAAPRQFQFSVAPALASRLPSGSRRLVYTWLQSGRGTRFPARLSATFSAIPALVGHPENPSGAGQIA